MDRALAAWREANPQGLIGRLVELHRRDPELAFTLAYYTERYYAQRTPPGEPWPYQWLMADVASWPVVHGPSRLRVFYQDMPSDQTLCLVFYTYLTGFETGGGLMDPITLGQERVRQFLEFERDIAALAYRVSVEVQAYYSMRKERLRRDLLDEELDELYRNAEGCPSCGGSGRWGDDIPCGRCGGGEGVR
jgi:hypothetical protein